MILGLKIRLVERMGAWRTGFLAETLEPKADVVILGE